MKPTVLNRDSNSISIANLYENHVAGKIDYNPSFQRESIWTEEKQSFLIDSILRNYPIPPIFLRQRIDDLTGKTSYEVIDGKQRLTSIMKFIKNEIPVSSEEEPSDEEYESKIAGLYFKELDDTSLGREYKKNYWRYHIPIEYIDTESDEIIKHIFDRLNRNGEPLTGQELRNAKYNQKYIHKQIVKISLSKKWKVYLENLDLARMENGEFIAELIFETGEKKPLYATQEEIDAFYKKYSRKSDDEINRILKQFKEITKFLEELGIMSYCKKGVSHFYGIWCFAQYCVENKVHSDLVKVRLKDFYERYMERDYSDPALAAYKKTMSSSTKSSTQRRRRRDSLVEYCNESF